MYRHVETVAGILAGYLLFSGVMTTITPDPPTPPVLPPDDPNAPDVTRLPSIDPPPTVPDRDAPSDDPTLPPPEPMTI